MKEVGSNQYNLDDFKYSYYSADKEEKLNLLQTVLKYPGDFTREVTYYVKYLWNRYYELYTLKTVNYEDVVNDLRYKLTRIEASPYTKVTGFKIYDNTTGSEIGQGLYDYQKSLNTVTIHYMEFIEFPPDSISISVLVNNLFMYKYNEDVKVRVV